MMRRMISRREFVAISSASLMATAAIGDPVAALSIQDIQAKNLSWFARMRRCGQININERDPETMDVAAWMDYWTSLRVNAILINGGGIVAFYPTEVPHHHRSAQLGSRDLLGEFDKACRANDVRLVARMDCNYAYEEALKARPEWFERNRDGSPRPHAESTWLFKTCMFSPYFTEQMPAIYREINQRYKVDGFFTNGWPSTGALTVCHCENCQRVYRDQVGGVPPDGTDATSPIYRKFYEVSMARMLDIWDRWNRIANEGGRESIYVGNLGGGIRTVKDVWRIARTAGWFNADHQGRSGNTPIWDCAQQGRLAQAVMKGRPITNVTGAYANADVVWRHVSKSPAEATLWMAQTTASGMVPWYHWLGASPEDTRWRETGRQFFQWLADHEAHFRNRESVADVGVLYPQQTIAFYRSGSGPRAWRGAERAQTAEYLQGLYYTMLEARVPFDFVHQDDLGAETLRKYKTLLLPNAAYLSDAQCQQIRAYVAGGGSLVATFETSLYNEWGDPRSEFALADLFGVSVAGEAIGPIANSYMRIEQRMPVTAGFEGTALLPGPENRRPVRAGASGSAGGVVLSVVPGYPAFPPEMVVPRASGMKELAAMFREGGAGGANGKPGRVAYFAGDIDRTCWRSSNTDLSRLLQNAIAWTRGDAPPLARIDGHGVVEMFLWRTEPGYALHLVNYTNPHMMRGWAREFFPIGPLRVDLAPLATPITSARALRAGRDLAVSTRAGRLQFEIPTVVDYEVIALT
jgi:Hypothetical glycosyl hydrolase 6/Beta-galactosidase trimerisation domain